MLVSIFDVQGSCLGFRAGLRFALSPKKLFRGCRDLHWGLEALGVGGVGCWRACAFLLVLEGFAICARSLRGMGEFRGFGFGSWMESGFCCFAI